MFTYDDTRRKTVNLTTSLAEMVKASEKERKGVFIAKESG